MRVLRGVFAGVCVAVVLGSLAAAGADMATATAVRSRPEPPRIDGVLNDPIWREAPIHEGFRQRDPDEAQPATERTTFQLAYDEEALYVGIQCFDTDPGRIIARLTRRDGDTEADWVRVSLDPRLDRQTGFWFSAYASGSVVDGVYSGDRQMDDAWDGVWDVETALHEEGWTAEYRIPYHVLRFAPSEEYVWGLNVERHISRKQERDQWSLVRRTETGLVSRFGRLQGIRGIDPPLHLEVAPYARGRTIVDGAADHSGSVGADVRYGITSSTSLTATINPDFGQVEADPATLNLTAFEDFFGEQRPFFVEGASIFDAGRYDVFHSRRIGRRPGHLELPEDAESVDRPEATTILGALKVTGKTEGKTSFGLLTAVTAEEEADFEQLEGGQPARARQAVEPLTNYLVGRVQQDVLDGTSTVGLLGTTVQRRDAESAYVGALDWDLRFDQERYSVSGSLVGSRSGDGSERHGGYIADIEIDKRGGWLETEAGVAALSRHVDLNDLGFLRRGDLLRSWTEATLYRHTPWGPFQRFDINFQGTADWNYDRQPLDRGVSMSNWFDTRDYWRLHLHLGHELGSLDDDDVGRGGPVIKQLAENWVHAQVETDDREAVRFTMRPELRRHVGGDSYTRALRVGLSVRPAPSILLSVEPRYTLRRNDAQWVDAIDGRFIYGELTSRTLDLSTRGRMSFTPDLSLELYMQPFVAIGEYHRFKELVEAETYRFADYDLGENRDFHRRSLKSNLVLRWEFQPGSLLYVVWSQSRGAAPEEVTADHLELRPLDRLAKSFTDDGSNLFLVKLSYWYGR